MLGEDCVIILVVQRYSYIIPGIFVQISWTKVQCGICVEGNGGHWEEKHFKDTRLTVQCRLHVG